MKWKLNNLFGGWQDLNGQTKKNLTTLYNKILNKYNLKKEIALTILRDLKRLS